MIGKVGPSLPLRQILRVGQPDALACFRHGQAIQVSGATDLHPDPARLDDRPVSPAGQLLRVQGNPTALARKLRYYADPEFKGLFQPQDQ